MPGSSSAAGAATRPGWSRPLGDCLGVGGFGAVWDIAGTANVLKVAHADHALSRARMRREAEAMAAVGTPAAPRFEGEGVFDDGRAWIEMERIAGVSVGELIASGPTSIHRAILVAAATLDALVAVHAAAFVHRDLKPDNLVLRPDGSIVILDLGLARRVPVDADDPTRPGIQVGSLEYMAPEQLRDAASVDVRADLYAFGCVLYELCAGRPPFVGDEAILERAHAALRPPPLSALANVPAALEALCHECLAKLPSRRPASAAGLAAQVRALRDEPTQHRTQRSRSVVSEGLRPAVLVWTELPRVDRALLSMLVARKVVVLSQRGRRVLGAIIGADHADPANAGILVARELAATGARVALHLASVVVTTGAAGVAVTGADVEHTDAWLPRVPWDGVLLTPSFSSVAGARTRATAIEGFLRLGEASDVTELFGREAVISDLTAEAAAVLAGVGPGLTVMTGGPGVGKTEVLRAVATALAEFGGRVVRATIPPPGTGLPGHELATVLGAPVGPVVRAVGDALRGAARAQPFAILLDDVHLASHELLDAIEYATLGGEAVPLWILAATTAALDQRRPEFGARGERVRRVELAPLDDAAAIAMAAALLHPAIYPPVRALRQLSSIARGNPMHLVALARELKDRGAIRTRPGGEHFLDPSVLDGLPTIALGPWLAARELQGLAAEQAALARLCAVLGDDLERDEVAAVIELVERDGGASTTVDVDVGLAELERAGILARQGSRWRFRIALVREGAYATTNAQERSALHVAALAHWRAEPLAAPGVAARIARHAEAVGDRPAAAAAFAELGARARADHRELDAEQAWDGALRSLDEATPASLQALLGRARARYRLQRRTEALADLERVIDGAIALGDGQLEIEALLEQAAVHDWVGSFEASRGSAERAANRCAALRDPEGAVTLGVALAKGRSQYRSQQPDKARAILETVTAAAASAGLLEIEIIGRMVLGLILVETGELDAGERELTELIALCDRHADRFHLMGAYVNRAILWSARGLVERGADDMRQVIQLAREGGQVQLERAATYNMAEDLLWQGKLDEALRLARRSLALQLGAGEGSAAVDRMLVARILAAREEREPLAEALRAITVSDELVAQMGGAEQVILAALRAVARQAAWDFVFAAASSLPDALYVEVALLAAGAHALPAAVRDRAAELAAVDPNFASRLPELAG